MAAVFLARLAGTLTSSETVSTGATFTSLVVLARLLRGFEPSGLAAFLTAGFLVVTVTEDNAIFPF